MDEKFGNKRVHCARALVFVPPVSAEVAFYIPKAYRDIENGRQDIPERLWVKLTSVFEQEPVTSVEFRLDPPPSEFDLLLVRTHDSSLEWIERLREWINAALDLWAQDLNHANADVPAPAGEKSLEETFPPPPAEQLPALREFPPPWSFDMPPQKTPTARNTAKVYAADSTPVCQIRGAHAEALATLIVQSVNQYLRDTPQAAKPHNNHAN